MHAVSQHMSNQKPLECLVATCPDNWGNQSASLPTFFASSSPADNSLNHLPESLGGLTNLQSMRATNNVLMELPDSLVDLARLTTLDVSLNRLKAVPERLRNLTGLKQLGLFAAFSHSVRNEGSSTIRVLADMT